jgi:hypothetical protein
MTDKFVLLESLRTSAQFSNCDEYVLQNFELLPQQKIVKEGKEYLLQQTMPGIHKNANDNIYHPIMKFDGSFSYITRVVPFYYLILNQLIQKKVYNISMSRMIDFTLNSEVTTTSPNLPEMDTQACGRLEDFDKEYTKVVKEYQSLMVIANLFQSEASNSKDTNWYMIFKITDDGSLWVINTKKGGGFAKGRASVQQHRRAKLTANEGTSKLEIPRPIFETTRESKGKSEKERGVCPVLVRDGRCPFMLDTRHTQLYEHKNTESHIANESKT